MTPHNILILGSLDGPHIDIVARDGYDKEINLQDGIDVIADARTIWQPIEKIRDLLDEDQKRFFSQMKLDGMAGCCGYCEGDMDEDETITPISMFFYYPTRLNPEEALKLIEIQLNGNLSPSLAIGLFVIANFLANQGQLEQGAHIGFVRIGGTKPTSGISYFSETSIQRRVRNYLDELAREGADIESYLPDGAVDRAKFMLALAETCWQPDTLRQLSQAIKNISSILPLFLVATPWIYLHPDRSVKVAGVNIPIKGNLASEADPWLQSLEWAAHQISADDLKFLLPPEGEFIDRFYFQFSMGYPEKTNTIAMELAKLLIEDAWTKPPFPPHNFRINLPGFYFFEVGGISSLRICGDVESGFWVGLELVSGISTSFWWRPQAELPMSWITGSMDDQLRSILHLTLAAIWRDITNWRETEFPYLNLPHYTGVQAYEWGRQENIQMMREEVRRAMKYTNISFWELPPPKAADTIFEMSLKSLGPHPKLVGRACLAILLQFCEPDLGGF